MYSKIIMLYLLVFIYICKGYSGDITWYSLCPGCPDSKKGYTACGNSYNDKDEVVAISKYWFKEKGNPNEDNVCKRNTKIIIKGKIFPVVDKCCGCKKNDIDMSPSAFKKIGLDLNYGRYNNITWNFLNYKPKYNKNGNYCPQTG